MHGEHPWTTLTRGDRDGPSPHARGTPETAALYGIRARTIPACTGNTRQRPLRAGGRQDHPRMHGEHKSDISALRRKYGPSPHARGTPRDVPGRGARVRTIPACTGNTFRGQFGLFPPADHPRMHGEHFPVSGWTFWKNGPSPHARGTRGHSCVSASTSRTIPACTGNTPRSTRTAYTSPDHPRMHGEHTQELKPGDYVDGPSPHARGTRVPRGRPGPRARTIPACTGNTHR